MLRRSCNYVMQCCVRRRVRRRVGGKTIDVDNEVCGCKFLLYIRRIVYVSNGMFCGGIEWKQLARGTLTMIEEGVREVAQLGFKHNVVESDLWMEEMVLDELVGGDIDPDVLEDRTLWAGKRGKAMGMEGWCEELLLLLRRLGIGAATDLDNILRLCFKYVLLPRYLCVRCSYLFSNLASSATHTMNIGSSQSCRSCARSLRNWGC